MRYETSWRRRLLAGVAALCVLPASAGFSSAAEQYIPQPATEATHVVSGTTYYVSASAGNDAHAGTSPATPWKTLTKASRVRLRPGDAVLLARGDTWRGQSLWPKGSGIPKHPIHIGAYGKGPRPHISPGLIPGSHPRKYITYAIHLVNNAGYKITDLELSRTYGGIVSYAHDTYNHRYLWIQNVFFHDITGKDTGFNSPVPTKDPNWWKCGTCYPALDLKWGTGVSLAGKGNGRGTVLSDVTITGCTFVRTDTGVEMVPSGRINYGMWRSVNIGYSQFWQNYYSAISLYHVTRGTTSHVLVDRAGSWGHPWGTTAFGMVGVRNYMVRDSEFRNTMNILHGQVVPPQKRHDGDGFDFEADNHDVTLRDSYIHDNAGPAILLMGGDLTWPRGNTGLVVANNRLHRNNKTKIKDGGVFNNWGGTWTDRIDGRLVKRTNRNDGVMRMNRIILTDNAQSYDSSPKGPPPRSGSLVFDNTNRVYNASGALVFPKSG